MEALIPAPADYEVRSVIKFLNAQNIASQLRNSALISRRFPAPCCTKLSRSTRCYGNCAPGGCRSNWHQNTVVPIPGGRLLRHSIHKLVPRYDRCFNSGGKYVENSWPLAVSVTLNISMQLCFVSVHGPRETYFVDEPRIWPSLAAIIHGVTSRQF
jgi:hypothetical protein